MPHALYGYATRTFSSRRIEAANYDSVAFRYIAAGSHPDHDTIASFRKRFLGEIDGFFVQILQIAYQMGFQKVGIVSLDGQSRTMPVSGGGFEQAYNCQAVLDNESGLILTQRVSQSPVDRNELAHAVEALTALPEELGRPEALLADAGYFSRPNVELCDRKGITPFISFGQQQHNLALEDRWHRPLDPEMGNPLALMKHRLKTPEGRNLYGRRKATIEPAFGVIKQVMGFRQFLLRGLRAVKGEWNLVSSAFNLKRIHRLYVLA